MARNTPSSTPPEAVISIIGAGMTVVGDTDTDGSLRIEGTVRGNVRAGKSVVVGRGGLVDGSVFTQDAVIAGRVSGGIHAESRLELQATSEVSGEIVAPRMQVEEGAKVQGQVAVGESAVKAASKTAQMQPQKFTREERPGPGGKGEPGARAKLDSEGKGGSQTESQRIGGAMRADSEPQPRELGGAGRAGSNVELEESSDGRKKHSHG